MARTRSRAEWGVIAAVVVVVVVAIGLIVRRGTERGRPGGAAPVEPSAVKGPAPQPRLRGTVALPRTSVYAVGLTPDGKHLVVAGSTPDAKLRDQPVVRVWDIETGREDATLLADGEVGRHVAAAVSPDGTAVAVTGPRVIEGKVVEAVAVWDLATRKPRWSVPAAGRVGSLTWSPDGSRFAGDVGSTVTVWTAADGTGRTWRAAGSQGVAGLAWSRGGDRLVVGGGVFAWVFDPATDPPSQVGVTSDWSGFTAFAFAPDDKTIYVAGRTTGVVWVWDRAAAAQLRTLTRHAGRVQALALTRDGRELITLTHDFSAPDGPISTVWGWDVTEDRRTWSAAARLHASSGSPAPFAVTPDGRRLALASSEQTDAGIDWAVSLYDLPAP